VSAAAVRPGADRTLELLGRQVGRTLSEVETPVAVIDLDRLEHNLGTVQSYVDEHEIALWPTRRRTSLPRSGCASSSSVPPG
jgi:predicted CoA-binding protein